ncbi:MAG: hypothetical protein LBL82_00315 [Oscillospiraceae bacterium]|nr:hypothetical protein [Oscillospiraceae bacterium]
MDGVKYQSVLRTITPEEATRRLRDVGVSIGVETFKKGIRDKVFPFGDYIEMSKGVYLVYASKFEAWIDERITQEPIPQIPKN